jgi:superoxide dismutase
MAHVVSVTSAREVSRLPITYNALEPYIDGHSMHAHYAANHRVGDFHGLQTSRLRGEKRVEDSS